MPAILGVDTSNYTTSAAVYDTNTAQVYNYGKLLDVNSGERGLRQSDAVFQHIKALPPIIKNATKCYAGTINAVGVSISPRDTEGSYMPVFLAGKSVASAISDAVGCPLYEFSHQRGHIAAALYSVNRLDLFKETFYAFHVSGGTTELLLVTPDSEKVINCKLIAHTLDLNAGQVIDRVGVMLGLNFPSGRELDALAQKGEYSKKIRVSVKDGNCCLSGVENLCKRLIDSGESAENIARFAIQYIFETIKTVTLQALSNYGNFPVVFAGGVMSNSIISKEMPNYVNCIFSKPEFSRDNAAGIAVLTAIKEGHINI